MSAGVKTARVVDGARSHPPSLLRHAERSLARLPLERGRTVILCACSGGPDSTALVHALARHRKRFGFSVVAHGVDHGLRADAAAELECAKQVCAQLEIPFGTTRLRLAKGSGIMARARDARYAALRSAAKNAQAAFIATGHTADDRAETLLIRLLQGAGPRGLSVLPEATAGERTALAAPELTLIRPLVSVRRAEVMAHLARHKLPSMHDPSNVDPQFLRVRVRREVLPLLESLSPAIVEHLCRLAEALPTAGFPAEAGAAEISKLGVAKAPRRR